jgi:hypothetical protein
MSIRLKNLFIMLLGGALCSAHIVAQDNAINWQDFSYIKYSEAWLTSYNAAGLKYLPVNDISEAKAYVNKKDGDFINYYQSDNSYELGAQIESFYRLNPKIVFYGNVSYSNFKGKNMGGSAFINPYYNPFDIVEMTDDNRGKKNLETYNLAGAISANLYKGLYLGGKIDYKTANYAKYKDLRHVNTLMNMYVTAGLSYKINDKFEIGANYYYRRSTEDIEFQVYGTTDQQYYSLINYGAFYGKSELFKEEGYTETEKKPLFNEFHGVSLQAAIDLGRFDIFNEITYKSRSGYYGIKASRSIVYSEHSSDIFEYNGMLSFTQDKNRHSIKVNIDKEKLENNENVYTKETVDGVIGIIVYYDPLKVADKEFFNAKVEYTANLRIENFNPVWTLKGGVQYHKKEQTISVYPYYRRQNIHYTQFNLYANRNIVKNQNMYSVSLGASYSSGGGTINNDGLYATPPTNMSPPANNDSYLHREYEYLTNKQIKGDIGFRYSRLFDKIKIKGYVAINYSLTKASDIEYLKGDKYNELSLTIGCTF